MGLFSCDPMGTQYTLNPSLQMIAQPPKVKSKQFRVSFTAFFRLICEALFPLSSQFLMLLIELHHFQLKITLKLHLLRL